jgi:tetratricopeptide (TPR) repeat protein
MTRPGRNFAVAELVMGLGLLLALPSPADARLLRGADAVAKVYDAILDADFERAEKLTAETCPPAPEEACLVLDATRLLWTIQIDPEQTRLDAAFTESVTRAIDAADNWTRREPKNAEAWFYLGGAYGARVQWRVMRGQTLAAARDGKQIKLALEQALLLDPAMDDAQFGLGLYEYYADVAPTGAKMLRWLLLLPGGNREVGLRRMQRARTHGAVLADEAAYQLHLIFLWYEQSPQQALALLKTLATNHASNPLFQRLVAEVLDTYVHDRSASLDAYRALLEAARAGKVEGAARAEVEARLGIARQLDAMGDTDLAIEELGKILLDRDPIAPAGAASEARVLLAAAYDRIGSRTDAERLYREVIAAPPARDPAGVLTRARRGLARAPDKVKATAYGMSLDAWRLFQRGGAAATAEERLERALALDPQNAIARYRYGRVLMARHLDSEALAELDTVLRTPSLVPPTMLAEAALAAATLHEQAHDRARAIDLYRRAASIFGASAQTRSTAQRALTKLQR